MTQAELPAESFESFSILEHLNELRIRLTWVAAGIVAGTIIALFFTTNLLEYILTPYDGPVTSLGPTDGIEVFFRIAITAGMTLSMPWIVYQLWLFIEPALTKAEKKYVYIFIPATVLLFVVGILFAWFVLVPTAINFLSTFLTEEAGTDIFKIEWTGDLYISFVLKMVFWLGVSFEMPVVFYFIGRFGLMTHKVLAEQWRFAIVGVAILAAIITPSIDPITMLITMLPLLILYFLSIGTTFVGYRHNQRHLGIEPES
ncbi:MAG: sec-independent protein translocase protein TatC [Cellvibrionaceae bacterium]|jgi:sec-independent protein translocase protein TatC